MLGMNAFQLLAARRPDRRELVRSLELALVRFELRPRRDVARPCLRELRTEDFRERLALSDRISQLDVHSSDPTGNERRHRDSSVGVGFYDSGRPGRIRSIRAFTASMTSLAFTPARATTTPPTASSEPFTRDATRKASPR